MRGLFKKSLYFEDDLNPKVFNKEFEEKKEIKKEVNNQGIKINNNYIVREQVMSN